MEVEFTVATELLQGIECALDEGAAEDQPTPPEESREPRIELKIAGNTQCQRRGPHPVGLTHGNCLL